ncbi:structural cement protein Gp24 [Methylorubrum extorquens]|uniref:Uncharacterized protein n=1 Tax=Methylorubrum extorquens DSM 13060 TaxID=882800 RepID=H1KC73_METEX|nr:hypothetical protein [Methylorubrum extorquens]EHP94890.1 hypothetical protein MetexDRAFT_0235 [Methylorubrum extorquens DSM 13060]
MANLQPTYSQQLAPGFPGMIANGEEGNRLSRTVEDAAGLAFGRAAFRGAGDRGCTATASATAGAFLGIAIANLAIQPLQGVVAGAVAADIYPQNSEAGLLNEGVIWVTAGSNTTQGAAAYVTSAGVFTATTTSNIAIPAVFDDTVSSGSLVRLRVRKA